jgi:hypothetical protein
MNVVAAVSWTEAWMSLHQDDTHWQTQVHRTMGTGDSAGSRFEEVLAGLWPEAAWVGEGRAPPVPGEPLSHPVFRPKLNAFFHVCQEQVSHIKRQIVE